MKKRHTIKVNSNTPPTVELDSEAHAAYVRFTKRVVYRTEVVACDTSIVTIDIARDGSVIGVELVGVAEFTIGRLLEGAGISAPKTALNNARYVAAKKQELVAC